MAASTTTEYDQPGAFFRPRLGYFVLLGIVGLTIVLACRVLYIQSSLQPRLSALADRQYQSHGSIPARRGMILDAKARVVAVSRLNPDLFIDPRATDNADDLDALLHELAPRVGLTVKEIKDRIDHRPTSRFIVLTQAIDETTADAVRDINHPAIGLKYRETRHYPLETSMAHVLGYIGRDGKGLEGIELQYNAHLKGIDGDRAGFVDRRRRFFWPAEGNVPPPKDGGHVMLTIDAEIQRIAETALDQTLEEYEAKSGVALLMAPRTGEILAMASRPTFDPNRYTNERAESRRNRVITDPIEPGSTFKPFIACAALEGRFTTLAEEIDCHQGSHRFGSRVVKDSSPHGVLTFADVVTYSSNIGMATIGERMGNEVLCQTVRRFGFGARTGIDYPGESSGVVRNLKYWNKLTPVSVSMGYEVSVTPLQLLTAFCSIVNDGVMVKPKLVKQLLSAEGRLVCSFETPESIGRTVNPNVARDVVHQMLVPAVERGTGKKARINEYRILGKTGTPKLTYVDRSGYELGAYAPIFVAAGPVEDPRVAIVVQIQRPNARLGYYGSTVAAPVAGRILAEVFDYLGVPPSVGSLATGM